MICAELRALPTSGSEGGVWRKEFRSVAGVSTMHVMVQRVDGDVRVSELFATISLAVDIGMAQPLETGLAVCLVAVELARRLGYEPDLMQRTYRLALLQNERVGPVTGINAGELG